MKQILATLSLILFMTGAALAQNPANPATQPTANFTIEGVIIRVISANQLVVWEADRLYPFTLYGVTLPDPDSVPGREAKKTVSELVFNKLLTVHMIEEESNPPLGLVIIREKCLNEALVRQGVARVSTGCKAEPYCGRWREAQTLARKNHIGIWKIPVKPSP
ncbi:MAG: thermonuclease family protein [Proteobacteria bacterium]|nr:thermonuclease family protein [Pseudomonadota bacterium]